MFSKHVFVYFALKTRYFRKNNPAFHPYESARMCNGIICACCGELLVDGWMRHGSKFDIGLLKVFIYLICRLQNKAAGKFFAEIWSELVIDGYPS